jgi:hypothetical protein
MKAPNFFRRIAAFALDYLLISGYIVVLTIAGSIIAFGPLGDEWQSLFSNPWRADLVAFVTLIFPVITYFALMESSESGATWGKRRMRLRVVNLSGERLSRTQALIRSAVKLMPWQLAHTCLFHIPGWPFAPENPPILVIIGFTLVWIGIGFYVVTLAIGPSRRTPYDWAAESRVVVSK